MSPSRTWSDDQLSAFLDGALPEAEAEALRDDLDTDESLAARLAEIAAADEALIAAFPLPTDDPVAARMAAMVEARFAEPPAEVVDLASRRRAPSSPAWRLPLAAGVALAIGVFAGGQFSERGARHAIAQLEATVIERDNPMFAVLEATPSAELVRFGQGDVVKPVLSFRDKDGRLCREFEAASDTAVAVGVACREDEAWRLEILLPASDRPAGETGYVQASGFEVAALDAVLDRLGAGAPLDAAAEKAALSE